MRGSVEKTDLNIVLALLWTLHYINRSFIYPLRQKDITKKMPVLIMFSAIGFNLINGFLNGYYLGNLSQKTISDNIPLFAFGLLIFVAGMYTNIKADNSLISLRKKGGKDYKIPEGFLFERISCPNHFGEIVEWIGFALMAWNIPAISFAFWTFANLAPRSVAHHHWYKKRFVDYPRTRKAIIPFIW
jgi:3-oxo-5-alpha-steroid 4-dehydrogenase 1